MRLHKSYSARPYQDGDLALLNPVGEALTEIEALPKDFFVSLVDKWDAHHHCGICFLNGRPLYIGGSFPVPDRPNTLEVFILPDKSALQFPCYLLRTVERWVRRLEVNTEFQIQTHSADAPHIDRFMQALKFTDTGVRRTILGVNYKIWRRS